MEDDRTNPPDDGAQGEWTNETWEWDDRPLPAHFDGRLTNADFVDPPPPMDDLRDADLPPAETEVYRDDRPLYDGRPIRDPYARRGGYRQTSDEVWARARADYLAGDAAETACARHGLALSTFRQRARVEGWRRQDQVDPEPVDLDVELEAGLPDYADIARHALVRMNRAVLAGRAPEAAGWMRIHRQMLDLARAEQTPPPKPKPAKGPDPLDELIDQVRELEAIAREAVALAEDDLEGRRRIMARAAAVETRPISHHSHHSDGAFPAAGSDTLDSPLAPP